MELSELQIKELEKTQYAVVDHADVEKATESLKKERRIIHFISTPGLDRGRDIMNPKGMDATGFEDGTKTIFFNHNYDFPIGANVKLNAYNDGVKAVSYFSKETKANDIYNMHLEGVLNSWSIGFGAVKDKNGNIEKDSVIYDEGKNIRTFNKWELFEYSSVGVPMNAEALDIAKSICKSFELSEDFKKQIEIIKLTELIGLQKTEIENLKLLFEELKTGNNLIEIKNEIEEIKNKVAEEVSRNTEISSKLSGLEKINKKELEDLIIRFSKQILITCKELIHSDIVGFYKTITGKNIN